MSELSKLIEHHKQTHNAANPYRTVTAKSLSAEYIKSLEDLQRIVTAIAKQSGATSKKGGKMGSADIRLNPAEEDIENGNFSSTICVAGLVVNAHLEYAQRLAQIAEKDEEITYTVLGSTNQQQYLRISFDDLHNAITPLLKRATGQIQFAKTAESEKYIYSAKPPNDRTATVSDLLAEAFGDVKLNYENAVCSTTKQTLQQLTEELFKEKDAASVQAAKGQSSIARQ